MTCWKVIKSNGWLRLPAFDRLERFGNDDFTTNHHHFRCSRPPGFDGIKMFDKMTRHQNIVPFILMFCCLVIIIKHFYPINIRKKPWTSERTLFCNEVIMTKTSKSIKTRRPWLSIWYRIFLVRPVLCLSFSFLHPHCL